MSMRLDPSVKFPGARRHGFVPISVDAYVACHAKSNPSEDMAGFRRRLVEAVAARKQGRLCNCGEPIWAIGSAASWWACFTCLTGEADPSEDYEIDEVLDTLEGEGFGLRSRTLVLASGPRLGAHP